MTTTWDCAVIGGGAAGLSAALVLGRARRRTVVLDAGEPSNRSAPGIGGLLGHDGRAPVELYRAGRAELSRYPTVQVRDVTVSGATAAGGGFVIDLTGGEEIRARRLLLATGVTYRLPDLPGAAELWGSAVFHCPFCHGWEARAQPLAVLAAGDRAEHLALLLRAWTEDVTVLSNGPVGLSAGQRKRLSDAGVEIDERRLARLVADAGALQGVQTVDGDILGVRAILAATTLEPRSTLADDLGVRSAPSRLSDAAVVVDELGRTSVRGVFAAGDLVTPAPSVAAAIASGSATAAAVLGDLLAEDVGLPVPPWPHPEPDVESVEDPREYWERRYADGGRIWSGRVNATLASVVSSMTPGRALDLGCGEGGDAVWLAEHGWQVTAVDIAEGALARARETAAAHAVADRIVFVRSNLDVDLPDGPFDLVSAQFLHSTVALDRPAVLAEAARTLAPGGQLVIVDHGAPPPWAPATHRHADLAPPARVLAGLAAAAPWLEAVRTEAVERRVEDPDGNPAVLIDNLMVLRRVG